MWVPLPGRRGMCTLQESPSYIINFNFVGHFVYYFSYPFLFFSHSMSATVPPGQPQLGRRSCSTAPSSAAAIPSWRGSAGYARRRQRTSGWGVEGTGREAGWWSRAVTASMEYSRSSPVPPHPTLVRWAPARAPSGARRHGRREYPSLAEARPAAPWQERTSCTHVHMRPPAAGDRLAVPRPSSPSPPLEPPALPPRGSSPCWPWPSSPVPPSRSSAAAASRAPQVGVELVRTCTPVRRPSARAGG
jgi:hypothetical protein